MASAKVEGRSVDFVEGFSDPLLDECVGAGCVDEHAARIWFRVAQPDSYRVVYRAEGKACRRSDPIFVDPSSPSDGTAVVSLSQLDPGTRYEYWVESGRGRVAAEPGHLETAPPASSEHGEEFSFAVLSCHDPFNDDGDLDSSRLVVLDASRDVLEKENCKRILWVGDQMYSDLPRNRSLFDPDYFGRVSPGPESILQCTRAQVRRLYHQRYRLFWNLDSWKALMREWPGQFMWDDHEVVDNFGCDAAHRSPRWRNLWEGARDAFYHYEASRCVTMADGERTSFAHGFRYGPAAVFLMDLRSEKRRLPDRRIEFYGAGQLETLKRFLATNAAAPLAIIVLTVPILHLPDWLATAGAALTGEASDAEDRWSHKWAAQSRDRLLRVLHAHRRQHPTQKLVLVGGDIHAGAMSELEWSDDTPRILQVTSSPITHDDGLVQEKLAELAPQIPFRIELDENLVARTLLLAGEGAADKNPFGGHNFAIIRVREKGNEVAVRFVLYGAIDGDVKAAYSSAEL